MIMFEGAHESQLSLVILCYCDQKFTFPFLEKYIWLLILERISAY